MKKIMFVWDNFGPIHMDRCEKIAEKYENKRKVIGIELFSRSTTYSWIKSSTTSFEKITIVEKDSEKSFNIVSILKLIKELMSGLGGDYFFCHYERYYIFIVVLLLRAMGQKIYVMNDSKFDDYQRELWRENLKYIMYLPYSGGLGSGVRSRDYLRFLGVDKRYIQTHYNALSINRVREQSGSHPAPDGLPFESRAFVVVARFVPKKNLFVTLEAYFSYRKITTIPKDLYLVGSGPLDTDLRAWVVKAGLSNCVKFTGFLQADGVAKVLAVSCALILLSSEEQFGNVIIEAQAMGLPCIVSTACGARDSLIMSGVNGFIVEPDNPKGAAYFMHLIGSDFELWHRMCIEARFSSVLGDTETFAQAVSKLIE